MDFILGKQGIIKEPGGLLTVHLQLFSSTDIDKKFPLTGFSVLFTGDKAAFKTAVRAKAIKYINRLKIIEEQTIISALSSVIISGE